MNNVEILLKSLLVKRGISSIYNYQDFHLNLVSDKRPSGQPPNIRIQLRSDWILNSELWWNDFLQKLPVDTKNMSSPYIPAKAFALFMLIDSEIEDVKLQTDNSLSIYFSKGFRLFIPGTNKLDDESWIMDSNNDDRFFDFGVICDAKGKLHLSEAIKDGL